MEMTEGGVYIGTPIGEQPHTRYWDAVTALRLHSMQSRPVAHHHIGDKNGVAQNHNMLIYHYLKHTDLEWMLMLDADAMLHPAALERMLSRDKRVIAPVMYMRKPPYIPTIHFQRDDSAEGEERWLNDWGWLWAWCNEHVEQIEPALDRPVLLDDVKGEPLMQIQRAGTHAMLVHRSALEAIEPPWFVPTKTGGAGSDFDFCKKVLAAGFELWLDKTVFAGHLQGDYCSGVVDWLIWSQHTVRVPGQEGVAVKAAP